MEKRLKKDRGVSGTNIPPSKRVTIKRFDSSDHGTFGVLSVLGFSWFTGELPNRDNASNISCIPEGVYFGKWTYSPRFKRMMYLLETIPNRGGIRIHAANLMGDDTKGFKRQLNGCIALGEKIGKIDDQKALLLSKPAVRQFETLMNQEPFQLEIVNAS